MSTLDDDLEAIFESDDLDTVCATFSDELCVRGWFIDATEQVNILSQEVEVVNPSFICPETNITDVKRGDSVEISGTTYTVERRGRTGVGTACLYLKT